MARGASVRGEGARGRTRSFDGTADGKRRADRDRLPARHASGSELGNEYSEDGPDEEQGDDHNDHD